MQYQGTSYEVSVKVSPYCNMTSYKQPRQEVLKHLNDMTRHIEILKNLYYPLENCKQSVQRVSDWSIDVSIYLHCLSYVVPLSDKSFPLPEDRAKWLFERTRALYLLSKTPNTDKLNRPKGRNAWSVDDTTAYENAKKGLLKSWEDLSSCFDLNVIEKCVPPSALDEWLKTLDQEFRGDYTSFR